MSEASKASPSRTVIVAFRNDIVADVYSLAFESVFGATVLPCADGPSVVSALRKHPSACVIVENEFGKVELDELLRVQSALARRSTIIVLGGEPKVISADTDAVRVEFLPARPLMRDLVALVEKAIRPGEAIPEYCKITLRALLVRSARLRSDVYVKLGEERFVKVLNADAPFEKEDYERFQAKQVDYLYLPRADFLVLMDDLLAKATELNANPETITTEAAVSASLAIFQLVHAAFETDGFTPQLQRLTVASVNLAVGTIKKNPQLSDLLSKLDANRDSYLAWHSTALSFLCCKLATMLGWHSEATFYKLSLAALLHDIVLPSDELARIQTLPELDASGLSERERARILRHPIEGALVVHGLDEIPGEVGFIVEQHHERPDGSGFPRAIDHKDISSISALFIIAHDVVSTMFDAPPSRFQMADFVKTRDAEKRYVKGSFGQVFRTLAEQAGEF